MRYKITFSYDGTLFHGYQKQDGYRSVEECFENALYNINNHTETKIYSSGRTDRGVHAKGQVAHFDLDSNMELFRLREAFNALLRDMGAPVSVLDIEAVNSDFHARFSAKGRGYIYKILNTRFPLILNDNTTMLGFDNEGAKKIIIYPEAGEE